MTKQEKELTGRLEEFVESHGGSKIKAAKAMNMSYWYLREIMLGRRSVSCPAVLKFFGLEKVELIRPKKEKSK